MKNIEAQTVARAFFDQWISRYGVPRTLTTDRGRQFELQLFATLLRLVSCQRMQSTPDHPATNGMVERWHDSVKAAIMCHSDCEWTRVLATVILGLRTTVCNIVRNADKI